MDYQNRVGSKKGSGGVAGDAETNQYRRERLRKLLLSKIDIDSDPYVVKNRAGVLECRLCLTTHFSEASYVTHTHGKRHQLSLMRRADKKKEQATGEQTVTGISDIPKKKFVKIGRPAYKITKIRDPVTAQKGLVFRLQFPKIKLDVKPRYRLMSSFEQSVEKPDSKYQYLIVGGEPYENVAFKISSDSIDLREGRTWDFWDRDIKEYYIQLFYM
ncbi:hypothetical protein FOA43_000080 [Brettanomyces nanus]|uniref:Uncharacterized protein n=1 Tax=Eeniella nana TaxID=13502 RepID=A0A875RYM5_EENNA|nr:uncharacterized protein FOA43_000080 [Brettanomyces nanus]QPG72779.1 hypothetical protein FOA43_000080 [Brettanomyces nanus]